MKVLRCAQMFAVAFFSSNDALAHGIEGAGFALSYIAFACAFLVYALFTGTDIARGLLLTVLNLVIAAPLALTIGAFASLVFNFSIFSWGSTVAEWIGLVAAWLLTRHIRDHYYPTKNDSSSGTP